MAAAAGKASLPRVTRNRLRLGRIGYGKKKQDYDRDRYEQRDRHFSQVRVHFLVSESFANFLSAINGSVRIVGSLAESGASCSAR